MALDRVGWRALPLLPALVGLVVPAASARAESTCEAIARMEQEITALGREEIDLEIDLGEVQRELDRAREEAAGWTEPAAVTEARSGIEAALGERQAGLERYQAAVRAREAWLQQAGLSSYPQVALSALDEEIRKARDLVAYLGAKRKDFQARADEVKDWIERVPQVQ